MDSYHQVTLSGMARDENDLNKLDYVMNVVEPGKNIPVQDPWYDGINAFEKVFDQLNKACERIADWIRR
jgi:protein-tyrosine phosphatase